MTWEEAGLISKYPEVMEALRAGASRNLPVPELQHIKENLEKEIENGQSTVSTNETR